MTSVVFLMTCYRHSDVRYTAKLRFIGVLDKAKAFVVEGNIKVNDNIITAKDASVVEEFAETVIKAVANTKIK